MARLRESKRLNRVKKTNVCARRVVSSPLSSVRVVAKFPFVTVYANAYYDEVNSIDRATSMVRSGKSRDLKNYEKLIIVE